MSNRRSAVTRALPAAPSKLALKPGVVPPGGWSLSYEFKGAKYFTPARTSAIAAVTTLLARIHSLGRYMTEDEAWEIANGQWAELVGPENLVDAKSIHRYHATTAYPPQVWGAKAWGLMEVYLSNENLYNPEEFGAICTLVENLLHPEAFTGCRDCYLEWRARGETPPTVSLARQWLVDVHNKVNRRRGVPEVEFATVAAKNRWLK